MKSTINILTLIAILGIGLGACKKDDPTPVVKVYSQEDQMARPAINTVFVATGEKDLFNQTSFARSCHVGKQVQHKIVSIECGLYY